MTSVWVVAESRFEWYGIKHICGDEKVALQRWNELRLKLIKENKRMVDGGYGDPWSDNITLLHNMNPGDSIECDYPDLKEWVLE
jgi:hypothetical protein